MVGVGCRIASAWVVLVGAAAATPDPAPRSGFEIQDEAEFRRIVGPDAELRRVATGMKFTEGPVWWAARQMLVFSDIPANELKSWSAVDGLQTFRKPSFNANGNTVDLEGRLVTCEHSGRRVSRLEADGKFQTVVDRYHGKRFNSPNDVVVMSDGSLWFTDPDYGLAKDAPREIDGCHVYRFQPADGSVKLVAKDFDKPNGLCFSPDESRLYVADSGAPSHIRVFKVGADGTLEDDGPVLCRIDVGVPDGIRCDTAGRIFSSAGDGVQIFNPAGALIGKILVPEAAANLCFGGEDGKTLFITARTSLYAIPVLVEGAKPPARREPAGG